jgi:hypothetical protein
VKALRLSGDTAFCWVEDLSGDLSGIVASLLRGSQYYNCAHSWR